MEQIPRTAINRRAKGVNIDRLENVTFNGKTHLNDKNSANIMVAESELALNIHRVTGSASSSEEFHTSRRSLSARKKGLKQRDRSSGLNLLPELRSSSRLASKSAVYQFSETSSEDSGSYPAYSYAELNDDSPAIDVVLTHRRKDGDSK